MARQRDYRAEYRARIARAEARGLSRKAARGHAGDILKRTPPTAHASAIYTTEAGARGYVSRLGANRKAKLVAVFDDGRTAVVAGKKGGMKPKSLRDYMSQDEMDAFAEARLRYARQQAGAGTAATPEGKVIVSRPSVVIGYQVVWQ